MNRLPLFYTDEYAIPLPTGHKFPMQKYRMVRDRLAEDGVFDFTCAPLASPEVIELAHDPHYVRAFFAGTLSAAAVRKIGFPWSQALVRRTLASVGGTLAATADAIASGFGGNLAGGTHHALKAEGAGFCVFNDIAVAIQWLREFRQVKRLAVVDLDVHQGDGTAEIFAGDADVLTASVHCRSNFPFRKQRSVIDIELEDGTQDDAYLLLLENLLPKVFAHRPEVLFYQAGVDPLAQDSLGKLSLTHGGLTQRDRMVMEAARAHRIPLVLTMGGGYSRPIDATVEAHLNTYRTAAEMFSGVRTAR